MSITVNATREGLTGKTTACGFVIDNHVPFIALPTHNALYKAVRITNPLNNRSCIAMVLDVGPWNISDDAYVIGINGVQSRPQAESGYSVSGDGTNKSGIDLGQFVWNRLSMKDNGVVTWEFVE